MSENQGQDAGHVPNVHENAVTGIDHEPVQGATSGSSGEPETVDHPTSGDPDATPQDAADDGSSADPDGYDSADTHAGSEDAPEDSTEAVQGDAAGSVDAGTAEDESGSQNA